MLFQAFAFSGVAEPFLPLRWVASPHLDYFRGVLFVHTDSVRSDANASCQEIFKVCPRKLADVIINNDLAYLEPGRQPPGAMKVKRLCEEVEP